MAENDQSPAEASISALEISNKEQSERPKRKAKTKEAMQRYLNRDQQFLQEKHEKKSK